jgi:hypothetical protein
MSPLDPNLNTREQDKFGLKTTGQTAVHVISENEGGSITPSGLSETFKVTTLDVTDTATPLPATALTNRNAMTVINHHASEILYIGDSNVTADLVVGTTSGYQLQAGFEFNIDITDDIILYGRAATGQTIRVQVVEIA